MVYWAITNWAKKIYWQRDFFIRQFISRSIKPILFLILILLTLSIGFANTEIPRSVRLEPGSGIIYTGVTYRLTLSASGVNSLMGMQYGIGFCNVAISGSNCEPSIVNTIRLESPQWTFYDRTADTDAAARSVSFMLEQPGTYRVKVSLNNIASQVYTYEVRNRPEFRNRPDAIPTDVTFEAPSTVRHGDFVRMVVSGRDVDSIRGMRFIAKACRAGNLLEPDQRCLPLSIGTDEILSEPRWQFQDITGRASASRNMPVPELLGVNPGFYSIVVSLNSIESQVYTVEVRPRIDYVSIVSSISPIILGQPFDVLITTNSMDIDSLRSLPYIGRYCRVETHGENCEPNNIGTLPDETLSSWRLETNPFWSRATRTFTLSGVEPGTYRVTAELDGILSDIRQVRVLSAEEVPEVPTVPEIPTFTFSLPTRNVFIGNQFDINLLDFVSGGTAPFTFTKISETFVYPGFSGAPIDNWCGFIPSSTSIMHCFAQGIGENTIIIEVSDAEGLTARSNLIINSQDFIEPPVAEAENQPPNANAGPDREGATNQVFAFDGTLSSDPDGSIVSYAWNFGDGAISNEQSPTHAYTALGAYTVTLTVTDNRGATATDTATITINNIGPTARITASTTSPNVNQVITLDASSSSDPDGSIVSYAWNFGDGASATGVTAQKSYSSAGTFTVTLTVTDNLGATGIDTAVINVIPITPTVVTVNNPPTVTISSDRTSGIVPATIRFTSTASDPDNDPLTYLWNFGDSTTSNEQNPIHTFNSVGDFTVTLTVTDNMGGSAAASVTIRIRAVGSDPVSFISASPTRGRVPLTVRFAATAFDSDGTIVSYAWNFGDSTTSNEQNPVHTYNAAGTYTARLTVTDDDGLTNTNEVIITVNEERARIAREARLQIDPIVAVDKVFPGDRFEAYIKLRNTDVFDIEDLQVIAIVPELDVMQVVANNIDLDVNQVRWLVINFDIPGNTIPDEYVIKLLFNTDDFDTFRYSTFEVE